LADAGDAAKVDEVRVRININTATAKELEALPGVGEVIAARIVAYREQAGPFRSVDDLIHVEGLSDRAIDKIRELVTTAP
jgi:competence protein ComEA